MARQVLRRKTDIGKCRIRIIMDVDTTLNSDKKKFNDRVVKMGAAFVHSHEEIVYLATEELERKP